MESDAIKYMTDLIDKWKSTHKEYTEVIYATTGQIRLGFFKRTKSNTDDIWAFSEGGYNNVKCYFNKNHINQSLNQSMYNTVLSSQLLKTGYKVGTVPGYSQWVFEVL